MKYEIQRKKDHQFRADQYAVWADSLFGGLEKQMGFDNALPVSFEQHGTGSVGGAITQGSGSARPPVNGSNPLPAPAGKTSPSPVQEPPITQNAPGGINIGRDNFGNPTVINNGPLPATLSFTEEVITSLTPNGDEKRMNVHITTDNPITTPMIGIVFSATIDYPLASPPVVKNATMYQTNVGQLLQNGVSMPNSVCIFVNAPEILQHNQELIVSVKSKEDVHVTKVLTMPK